MTEHNAHPHIAAVDVPQDFAAVVVDLAAKANRTFSEQLVYLAVYGAECARLHKESR